MQANFNEYQDENSSNNIKRWFALNSTYKLMLGILLLFCFLFSSVFVISKVIINYNTIDIIKNEISLPMKRNPQFINFYFNDQSIFIYKSKYNYSIFSFNKQNYEYKQIADITLKSNYIIFPYQKDKIIFFNAKFMIILSRLSP